MSVTTGLLLGQESGKSNRNFSDPERWGKNQFNSSFPTSLIMYMYEKGVNPKYLFLKKSRGRIEIKDGEIDEKSLFGLLHTDPNIYFQYETDYEPYRTLYTAKEQNTQKDKWVNFDLVIKKKNEGREKESLRGFEIKLTALPDSTTQKLSESEFGCEIVVRPPTILSIACSICQNYDTRPKRAKLLNLLNDGVPSDVINHLDELSRKMKSSVYSSLEKAVLRVCGENINKQVPLLIQPVWKTTKNNTELAEDCLA